VVGSDCGSFFDDGEVRSSATRERLFVRRRSRLNKRKKLIQNN
jgi:hypothetical protein